jgi:hypothetical protein
MRDWRKLRREQEIESREQRQQQRSRPRSNRKSPALDERACRTGFVELACRRRAGLGRSQGDTVYSRRASPDTASGNRGCGGWLLLIVQPPAQAAKNPMG